MNHQGGTGRRKGTHVGHSWILGLHLRPRAPPESSNSKYLSYFGVILVPSGHQIASQTTSLGVFGAFWNPWSTLGPQAPSQDPQKRFAMTFVSHFGDLQGINLRPKTYLLTLCAQTRLRARSTPMPTGSRVEKGKIPSGSEVRLAW